LGDRESTGNQEVRLQISIDGKGVLEVRSGVTPRQLLAELARDRQYFAVSVDGELVDLDAPIDKPCNVRLVGFDTELGRQVYWHSTSPSA
jgi:sulfur carrier protein ThiS